MLLPDMDSRAVWREVTLPLCAAASFSSMHMGSTFSAKDAAFGSANGSLHVVLAAMVPLAALVAAATIGRALWKRGQWTSQHQLRTEEQQHGVLLVPQPFSGARSGGDAMQLGQEGAMLHGTRARLRALLQDAVRGQREAVALLPLEALPAALAHQLGSMRGLLSASRGPQDSRAADSSSHLQRHLPAGDTQSLLGGSAASSAWLTSDVEVAALDSNASRQWGLATDSLHVSLGVLMVS